MSMWRTVVATTIVFFALANAISESSAEETHLIRKRLGGRLFRRPLSTIDWYKRTGDDLYNYNSDDFDFEKRGGARFNNYNHMVDFDQSPYRIDKRPGARFLGGGSYGYYPGYAKRPGRRYYRSVDAVEREKKPGGRFMSFNPHVGKKRYDDQDDYGSNYDERWKRSRYGYPSWLRSRAG